MTILAGSPVVIKSKLTSKARTTIPQRVRAALRLREGDELVYEIDGGRVVLYRARQIRADNDLMRAFSEWDSDADRQAYGGL